jgi:hypothetical protein
MEHSRLRGHAMGTHHSELENDEMIAIDQAFHWSAILHIYRRVLAKNQPSAEIDEAVDHLCNAIARIRPGSSTECSVLFPLFTAGCEVRDAEQRLEIMTRVMNFEAEGLKQVWSKTLWPNLRINADANLVPQCADVDAAVLGAGFAVDRVGAGRVFGLAVQLQLVP